MMWNLPIAVEIDGIDYSIRNECDYRVVLDVISALNDAELDLEARLFCALSIFYDDLSGCRNIEEAVKKMYQIIDIGEDSEGAYETETQNDLKLMDWEHDFKYIAPAISRVLGYSVRDEKKYTHWYDFIGAYMEIGECAFSTIISIRSKRQKYALCIFCKQFYKRHP